MPTKNLGVVLNVTELPRSLAETWDGLGGGAGGNPANAFLTPHYARTVGESRGGVHVCVVQTNGQPIGFLPFQFRSQWHRALGCAERVGGDLTDAFGIASRPGQYYDPGELVCLAGVRSFFFTHLLEEQRKLGLAGEQPVPGLRVVMGKSYWEDLQDNRPDAWLEVERLERKLLREVGPLKFEWKDARPVELEKLLVAKSAQYKRTGRPDVLGPRWRRELMYRLMELQEPTCEGLLSTLYAGNVWVASHFGLRHSSVLHYWFPVYNRELKKFSPGRLLEKRILQQAPGEGVTVLDHGEGDTSAKRYFANEEYQTYRGMYTRPGLSSVMARLNFALEWRVDRFRAALAR